MLSLTKTCRFPLLMLVAMRGEWAEFNPWQVPMGSRTQAALELCDVLVYSVELPGEAAETVAAALEAELSFYGQILGFDQPGVPKVDVITPNAGTGQ